MDWTILTSILGGAVGASVINYFANLRLKKAEHKHASEMWVKENEKQQEVWLRNQDKEHQIWLRDQKVKLYTEFIARFETSPYWVPSARSEPDSASFYENLQNELAPLVVLGADDVVEKIKACADEELRIAIRKVSGSMHPPLMEYKALVSDMVEAMNEDLHPNRKSNQDAVSEK